MNVPMQITVRKIDGITCTAELYKKYKRCIQKAAWAATKVCTETYDELLSRGNLIFCEACKTYDRNKGAFITHLTWKLLTLKQTAKEMYTPSVNGVKQFWVNLDDMATGKEGNEIGSDPIDVCEKYTVKMEESCDDPSWEARLPAFRRYMECMDEDTRMLCKDILDGKFENLMYKQMGPKMYFNHITNIPFDRFYSKRYIKLGWSKVRTKNALDNLRQVCRRYLANKAPVMTKIVKDYKEAELF